MTAPHILITGASGFLGRAVVAEALVQGCRVRATSRRRIERPPAEWIECDLIRGAGLERLLEDVDVVVHAAGLAHRFGDTPPEAFARINTDATRWLARAAARAGVREFVLISSASVYGPQVAVRTEATPCAPDTFYGKSKLAGEREANDALAGTPAHLTVLRPVTLYGAGDPGNVSRLMTAIDRRRFLWVGSGANEKSLLHVADAARAVLLATQVRSRSATVFNVGGATVPMREVVEELAHHLGRRVPPIHIPAGLALGLASVAAVAPLPRFRRFHTTLSKWLNDDAYEGTLFESTFGFRPRVPLSEGLREEVEWYRRGKLETGPGGWQS